MAIEKVLIDFLDDLSRNLDNRVRKSAVENCNQTSILTMKLLAIGLSAEEGEKYAKEFAAEYAAWQAAAKEVLAGRKLIYSEKFAKVRKAQKSLKRAFKALAAVLEERETIPTSASRIGPALLGCPINDYNRAIRRYLVACNRADGLEPVNDDKKTCLAYEATLDEAKANFRAACHREDDDYNKAMRAFKAARKAEWLAREAFCVKVRIARAKTSVK